MDNNLTQEQIEIAFIRAVTSFSEANARWQQRAITGLTDEELIEALRYELGEHGGSSGYGNIPSIVYTKAKLRIWIGDNLNHCTDQATLQEKQTMVMARRVFNISNPDDKQMSLF